MQKIKILLSDELKSILEEIQPSSAVANLLLSDHNFSDIKEDYVNYISISNLDKTKLSYLTRERLNTIPELQDPWTYNKRFFARPASVVNKIFKSVSDRELEVFNNLYKSVLSKIKFTFKVLSGDDIRRYYHSDTYNGSSGSLGNSCMKYDGCQRYLSLYVDNPGIISMLAMFNEDGYIIGRALLWDFDSNKVMDRIYTENDEELSYHFKRWAISNNYIYKHEQKWNNSLSFEVDGKKVEQNFSIQLTNWKYDKYPYMDTFKFFDKTNGILFNNNENVNLRTLCAADGNNLDNDYLSHDFVTGLFYYRGETVGISYRNGENISNYLRTYTGNTEWSRVNDRYILKSDAEFSEDLDDFIFNKELSHLNDQEAIIRRMKDQEDRRRRKQMEKARHDEMIRMIYSQSTEAPSLSRGSRTVSSLVGDSGEIITYNHSIVSMESDTNMIYHDPSTGLETPPIYSVPPTDIIEDGW